MRKATIENIFRLLSKKHSNPQTELKYKNQYTFLDGGSHPYVLNDESKIIYNSFFC